MQWLCIGLVWIAITAPSLLACSCSPNRPTRACQLAHQTPVIFRARAIDNYDNGKLGFERYRLYRFQVLERFKGLSGTTNEVFISPGDGTSCSTTLAMNQDYLFYLASSTTNLASIKAFLARRDPAAPTPLPAPWEGLENLPVYQVSFCNPSWPVAENDPDLAYLRAPPPPPNAPGSLEGRAVQNAYASGTLADLVPARDAVIRLTSGSTAYSARVGPDGVYRIPAVAPGKYAITSFSPTLGAGELAQKEVEIPPGGCAINHTHFDTNAVISGTVLDSLGNPAPGIPVELHEIQPDGRARPVPDSQATSDARGTFLIRSVPHGRIVLATQRGRPYYFPGTYRLPAAAIFRIRPNQDVTGVTLRLPPP